MKGNQKLTDDQVRAIREEAHHGARGKDLAAKYGVSAATISQIRHGQTRRKVKPAAWKCPIAKEGCEANCGNYGCGN